MQKRKCIPHPFLLPRERLASTAAFALFGVTPVPSPETMDLVLNYLCMVHNPNKKLFHLQLVSWVQDK